MDWRKESKFKKPNIKLTLDLSSGCYNKYSGHCGLNNSSGKKSKMKVTKRPVNQVPWFANGHFLFVSSQGRKRKDKSSCL